MASRDFRITTTSCALAHRFAMDAKTLVFRAQDAAERARDTAENLGSDPRDRAAWAMANKVSRELARAREALEALDRAVIDAAQKFEVDRG